MRSYIFVDWATVRSSRVFGFGRSLLTQAVSAAKEITPAKNKNKPMVKTGPIIFLIFIFGKRKTRPRLLFC